MTGYTSLSAISSGNGRFEPLLDGDLAKLVLGPSFDLSDALLGDAQFLAERFQGLLAGPIEAETANDDPPFAIVESAEHPLDGVLIRRWAVLVLMLVAPVVGGGLENVVMAGDEPVAAMVLLGDRPGEILHDRPAKRKC